MKNLNEFKPKLSSNIKIKFFKEDERGKFYIISKLDPKNASYLKIHEIGKEIINQMNGQFTVMEISEKLKKENVEVNVVRFVDLLGKKGFLENYPYIEGVKEKEERKLRVYYIPFFKDLETTLSKIYPVTYRLFRKKMFIAFVFLNLIITSLFTYMLMSNQIDFTEILFVNRSPFIALVFYLLILFPLLGLLHEVAHAIVCFHYGGKVGEIGMAVYLFAPFFYVDTSGTWMLTKKQSIMVFLAGPLFTLFVGNCSFLLYLLSPSFLVRKVFLMMAFASYFAVLFGLNPLMETDGYYILQTLVKFPNLHSHAWNYIGMWLRHKFRRITDKKYREFITCYSRKEQKILVVYVPLVVVVNMIFVLIMAFWMFILLNEYWNLTGLLIQQSINVEMSILMQWIFETVYLSIAVFLFLYRILVFVMKHIETLKIR